MERSPKEVQAARIERARSDVKRLAGVVTDQTVKDVLADATRDLNEATIWLESKHIDTPAEIPGAVDTMLAQAEARIAMARDGVARFGADFRKRG
jgi:hypothetical protein